MKKNTTLDLGIYGSLMLFLLFSLSVLPMRAQEYDFVQNDLLMVVMEAENYSNNIPKGLSEWLETEEPLNYSGTGAMIAVSDQSFGPAEDALAGAGLLVYTVNFTEPGTYYVWARASATSGSDDSYHVGINGTIPESGTYVNWEQSTGAKDGNWDWILWTNGKAGPQCSVEVPSAGVHEIEVYIRENGFRLDKLVLTVDPWDEGSGYAPDSIGPPETKVGTGIASARLNSEALSVYPNPVGDQLDVFIREGAGPGAVLEILDITGKAFRRVEADFRRSVRMDVSDLRSGVYFVRLSTPGRSGAVQKMLKY
jgi:hypothetical protein